MPADQEDHIELTQELMEMFYSYLVEKGRTPETMTVYRHNMNLFYNWLPEGKMIQRGTAQRWQEALQQKGYAAQTINTNVSTVNSFLEFCGRREFQVTQPLAKERKPKPELTREEYIRLLTTAKLLGRERTYLLIKVLANTELGLLELPQLTVEAVCEGCVHLANRETVRIPPTVAEPLLDYAMRRGIRSGPVFLTRNGAPVCRTDVTSTIRVLHKDALLPAEKCTPRALKKLYQSTRGAMEKELEAQLNRMYDDMMEQEEERVGWENR